MTGLHHEVPQNKLFYKINHLSIEEIEKKTGYQAGSAIRCERKVVDIHNNCA